MLSEQRMNVAVLVDLFLTPHSCQPDCPMMVVYDLNHEYFSHSLQETLGASFYGYRAPWLRETPCEMNLTSETYFVCL